MRCRHCGSAERASQCCERKLSSKPWTGVPKKVLVKDALAVLKNAIQTRNHSLCSILFEAIAKNAPNNNALAYLRGLYCWQNNKQKDGFEFVKQAYENGLRHREITVNLARLAVECHHNNLAASLLSEGKVVDGSINSLQTAFDIATQARHFTLAVELGQTLVNEQPESSVNWLNLLKATQSGGFKALSHELALRAIEQHPSDVNVNLEAANIFERANDLDAAERSLLVVTASDDLADVGKIMAAKLMRRRGTDSSAKAVLEQISPDTLDGLLKADYWSEWTLLERSNNNPEAALESAAKMHQKIAPSLLERQQKAVEQYLIDVKKAAQHPVGQPFQADVAPIFIVGFPRCGSTMLEKLIYQHFDCLFTDENPAMDNVEQAIYESTGQPWWTLESALPSATLAALSERLNSDYLMLRNVDTSDSPLALIDKNLTNFTRLPLISQLFPNALIIKLTRQPLDCVLSCFMNKFAQPHPWQHSLQSVAEHYVRLEQHWRSIKPDLKNPLLEMDYESVAVHGGLSDEVIAQMSDHWSAPIRQKSSSDFRPFVSNTASYAQVENSVNKSSINFSDAYKNFVPEEVISILNSIEQ